MTPAIVFDKKTRGFLYGNETSDSNLSHAFIIWSGTLLAGLPPIARVVDGLRLNAELSIQRFHECLYAFYLKVGWVGDFAVSYNADADGLTVAVPGSAWDARPLSLPFFGRLYLAVAPAEAVADNKVAVDILGTGQAVQRSQLLNIAAFGAAIVNFDAAPAFGGLSSLRANGFLDRTKLTKDGKRKETCRGRIITYGHQDHSPGCH